MKQRLKIVISLAAGCAMMLSCVCAGAESGANQEQNRGSESVNVYKTIDQHNPVMVQRFGADPWAMVYNGGSTCILFPLFGNGDNARRMAVRKK